ncbi:MAG: deoxyguanosinetriphosphate triphosphohydrolase [Pseudomonadota bacterium]
MDRTLDVLPANLSPLAARPGPLIQRIHMEPEGKNRSAFRRDRDRIVHAQAFRRLAHKTQVFISEEGDHYRTRLTHTIEVAQIARSIARNLGLDSDLAEALALAHDMGHTPFGHTGEDALASAMQPYGGFEHNAQTLRIVTKLERRYAAFDGLNLTLETLCGIIKHNGPVFDSKGTVRDEKLGGSLPFALTDFLDTQGLDQDLLALDRHAGLEAQIASVSDDIAYNTHDIDDGVRAGLFKLDDLSYVPLVNAILVEIDHAFPDLQPERRMGEFTRQLITRLIGDVQATIETRLETQSIQTCSDIEGADAMLATFSDEVAKDVWQIRTFLFNTLYRNDEIMQLRGQAEAVVQRLFNHLFEHPNDLPDAWQLPPAIMRDAVARARQVCDFVAGMTDRYALTTHARLFDVAPDLRYGASL